MRVCNLYVQLTLYNNIAVYFITYKCHTFNVAQLSHLHINEEACLLVTGSGMNEIAKASKRCQRVCHAAETIWLFTGKAVLCVGYVIVCCKTIILCRLFYKSTND